MIPETRFSSELLQIADVPEPLQTALRKSLHPKDIVSLLVYKPTETASGVTSAAKLLAVTNQGFVFVESGSDESSHITKCGFDAVLLIEVSTLLLYGHLKIHYVENKRCKSLSMEHNVVADDVYRRAVALMLEGIADRSSAAPASSGTDAVNLKSWPLPIRDAAAASILSTNVPNAAAWWPSVHGGFGYELAPMGAVLAVDDQIVVVIVEQAGPWNRVREAVTYGTIATYIPSNRLAELHPEHSPKFTIFELEMHARHGGERFSFMVPRTHEAPVEVAVEAALSTSRAKGWNDKIFGNH